MASGVEFTGNGDADVSAGPSSTNQPETARRGAAGPVQWTGEGGADVGGTIDTGSEKGEMPRGGDVVFTGSGSEDV